jgi:hypothetical protein
MNCRYIQWFWFDKLEYEHKYKYKHAITKPLPMIIYHLYYKKPRACVRHATTGAIFRIFTLTIQHPSVRFRAVLSIRFGRFPVSSSEITNIQQPHSIHPCQPRLLPWNCSAEGTLRSETVIDCLHVWYEWLNDSLHCAGVTGMVVPHESKSVSILLLDEGSMPWVLYASIYDYRQDNTKIPPISKY